MEYKIPEINNDASIPQITIDIMTPIRLFNLSEESKGTFPRPLSFAEEPNEISSNSELANQSNQKSIRQHSPCPQTRRTEAKTRKVTKDNYNLIKLIGDGAFSKVVLVDEVKTGKIYAMKIMDKAFLSRVISYLILGKKRNFGYER